MLEEGRGGEGRGGEGSKQHCMPIHGSKVNSYDCYCSGSLL